MGKTAALCLELQQISKVAESEQNQYELSRKAFAL